LDFAVKFSIFVVERHPVSFPATNFKGTSPKLGERKSNFSELSPKLGEASPNLGEVEHISYQMP
jgi:hypothetical protein